MQAKYDKPDNSSMTVTIDGSTWCGVVPQNPLWHDVVAEVERTKKDPEPFVIAPYVAPVIDPKVARANALASIGWRLEQIKGYEVMGMDASEAIAKYKMARAKIDAEFPNA